jgi:hypothetical protein
MLLRKLVLLQKMMWKNSSANKQRSRRFLIITVATLTLNLIPIDSAFADPASSVTPASSVAPTGSVTSNAETGADQGEQSLNNMLNMFEQCDKQRETYYDQIEGLKTLYDDGQISLEARDSALMNLRVQLVQQQQYIKLMGEDFKEYENNHNAFVYKTRAQKYLPYVYALVALAVVHGNTWSDKAVIGLAGFGTGALVEGSGYGLSNLTTWAGIKLNLFSKNF